MGIRIVNPAPNPWADAFGLLGTILGKNAADRQDKKDMQSAMSMYDFNPNINTAPYVTDTTGYGVQQRTAQGLLGNPAELASQITGVTQPTNPQTKGIMPTDWQATQQPDQAEFKSTPLNNTNPYATRTITPTRADIKQRYNQEFGKWMKEQSKTMSPEAFKQYMPMFMQHRQEGLNQALQEFDKQEQTSALDAMFSAKTYADKLKAGVKAGMNPQLLKMALDSGVDIKVLDMGDKYVPVGIDNRNNKVIDLKTGQDVDVNSLVKGIPAAQQAQMDLSRELHYTPSGSSTLAHSGGGSGRYIDVPGLGKMTPAQVLSAYKAAKGGVVEVDDGFGNIKKTTRPADPDVLHLLEPIVKQVRGELGLPPMANNTGDQEIDIKAAQMRSMGAGEDVIAAMIQEEIQKKQKQAKPISSGNDLPISETPWLWGS